MPGPPRLSVREPEQPLAVAAKASTDLGRRRAHGHERLDLHGELRHPVVQLAERVHRRRDARLPAPRGDEDLGQVEPGASP